MLHADNLSALTESALIEIIDQPKNIGTDIRTLALGELDKRKLDPEMLIELAKAINPSIAYQRITEEDIAVGKVSMHESMFLDSELIRQIYIEQLEEYIKYKDQFRFDVWAYAIGGV